MFKELLETIKKYDTIIIHRHSNPDGDALGSQVGLLHIIKAQAEEQLNSGESLLDPNCAAIMERTFDPSQFYLTDHGFNIFYPLSTLGPYAEGIPVFTVPFDAQVGLA